MVAAKGVGVRHWRDASMAFWMKVEVVENSVERAPAELKVGEEEGLVVAVGASKAGHRLDFRGVRSYSYVDARSHAHMGGHET